MNTNERNIIKSQKCDFYGTDPSSFNIHIFELDYPDNVSVRNGAIFGNQDNNIPVRVRLQISDPDGNDVTTNAIAAVSLYDTSTNKAVVHYLGNASHTDSPPSHGSQSLISFEKPGPYTLGFYPSSTFSDTRPQPFASLVQERIFYVQSPVLRSTDANLTLGAFINTLEGPVEEPESEDWTSKKQPGGKGTLRLTATAAMDYADTDAWDSREIASSVIPTDNVSVGGFDSKYVEITSKQWQLQNRKLSDSPLRLTAFLMSTVNSPDLVTDPGPVAYSTANNHDTAGNARAQATIWSLPVPYKPCILWGRFTDKDGWYVEFNKGQVTLLPASNVNNASTAVTLMQATVTVKHDRFFVKYPGVSLNTRLRITDNVGHNQIISVVYNATDGKPAVSGRG